MSQDFWLKALAKAQGRKPPLHISQEPGQAQPTTHTANYRPWWDTTTPTTPQQPPQQQQTPTYSPHQAQSIQHTGRCPHCGSGNYMPVQKHPFETYRCFDCSPMQSVAAVQNTGGETVQPARQISTENNFNPGVIVARG